MNMDMLGNDALTSMENEFNSNGTSQESQCQTQKLQSQKRIPTFKEFGETIKQLEYDNFQLKLRLYLQENGKSQQRVGHNNVNESSAPSAATVELMNEFQNLRQSNETLQLKLGESENRIRSLQLQINEGLNGQEDLIGRNVMLKEKLDILDRELALLKLKKQEDEDIEKCIQAFNGEDDMFSSGQIHAPSSPQFLEFQRLRMEGLEKEKESWKEERLVYEEERNALEEELWTLRENVKRQGDEIFEKNEVIKKKDEQFKNSIGALRDLGDLYKTEQAKTKKLETKVEDFKRLFARQKEICEKSEKATTNALAKEKAISERLSMTKKMMDLLKNRLTELIAFLEALLELDSRGIVALTGLTPENRKNLRVSLDQSQLLSETLVQSLSANWNEEEQREAHKLKFSKLGLMQAEHIEIPRPDAENNYLSDGGDALEMSSAASSKKKTSAKISTAVKSIQCECDDDFKLKASSQINLLTTEKQKLEEAKNRLVTEKGMLYARVATLEANLNAIKELSYPLQIENLKIQIDKRTWEKQKLEKVLQNQDHKVNQLVTDNRSLIDRLRTSEHTLKNLHQQQSKLVSELRDLRTVCPVKEDYEKIIKVGLSKENRQDSSPDLGIESGHDGASTVSSPKQQNVKSSEEYKLLKSQNKELASKLKHTKLALAKTLEKLDRAAADKEHLKKSVCRELHQTHSILKDARVRLEVEPGIHEF